MTFITRQGAVICAVALLTTACSADQPDDSASTTTTVEPLSFVMADEVFKHPAGEAIQIDVTDHCFESRSPGYSLWPLVRSESLDTSAGLSGGGNAAAISKILHVPVPTVFPPGRYKLQVFCGAHDFTEDRRDFIVDIIDTGIEPPELPQGQQVVLDQHRLTIDLANTIAPDDPRGTLYVRIRAADENGEPRELAEPDALGEPRDLSEPGPPIEGDWAISHSVRPPPADIDNVILVIDIPKDLHGPFTVSLGSFGEDNNPTFNLQLE